MDFVAGYVNRVVYESGPYHIFGLKVVESNLKLDSPSITVKGNIYGLWLGLSIGMPLKALGKTVKDRKYGLQVNLYNWEPWAQRTTDTEALLRALGVNHLAAAYLSGLGLDILDRLRKDPAAVLDSCPEELAVSVEGGISLWRSAASLRDLSIVLKLGSLTSFEIECVVAKFGSDAPSIVKHNPYRIMEVRGIPFVKADTLALKLGVPPEDERRVEGLVLRDLQEALKEGHLFLSRDELLQAQTKLPKETVTTVVSRLVERHVLIEEPAGVYLPEFHSYEQRSAQILTDLMVPSTIAVDPRPFLKDYECSNQITLSDNQRLAVEQLVEHPVLVLTGGPGTGKTTAVRALVRVFEEARIFFTLVAPTGIAAKRLAAVTGHPASTVHRALGYDGSKWFYNETNRLSTDAVVLDEGSMVDQELFFRLLCALREGTRLVLVGDDAQLPSVGPGNVLRELVKSCVPGVRLTHIFRQAERSAIVVNSHRINKGENPELIDFTSDSDFKFIKVTDDQRVVEILVKMAEKLKGQRANFQTMSAKYAGTVGVDNLNNCLREVLNPRGSREWSRGAQRFRLGDRLVVTKNDYKRNIYNGDMAKLVRITEKGLVIKVHGVNDLDMEVEMPNQLAEDNLRLAYALTVHRSQGNEFDTVILPMSRSMGIMLQRNLLYTAVTRARKQVWILGDPVAVAKAVANNRVIRRNTRLADVIADAVAKAKAAARV